MFHLGLRHLPLAQRGERLAARYLRWRGYRILERNARLGDYEIDLIARKGDTTVFVEVKTRQGDDDGGAHPEDSVGPAKQRHIRLAARRYIARHPAEECYYRYDVVAVIVPESGKPRITHYPNAFPDA